MEASIIAALISAVVASVGVFVSILSSRWAINLKTKELDLKNNELVLKIKEFGTTTKKLANDLEAIRQSQFSETIHKRAEIYPLLWSTIRKYTTNWDDEKKPKDLLWVKEFLANLNQVDSEGGVFFSQAVYEKFHALQLFLFQLKEQLSEAETKSVRLKDLEYIDTIFRGQQNSPGLAAYLKDDLGSYRDLSIQARSISTGVKSVSVTDIAEDYSEIEKGPANVFFKSAGCPPVPGYETRLNWLRQEYMKLFESVLLTPNASIIAIESILKSQSAFNDILEYLREYFSEEYIEEDEKRNVETTESLFASGLIDEFAMVSLRRVIETEYRITFDDSEWFPGYFDTLLELAVIVYNRIPKELQK